MNKKIDISKSRLENLYIKKLLSTRKIAEMFGCNSRTIRNRLVEFKLEKRSASLSRMKYKKFNFSENLTEKAYILGFRLGDLNVYQRGKNSETIVARCNTTTKEQTDLISRLFAKYGKVTVSIGEKYITVNCFLNNSFSFLLLKNYPVPEWVNKNTKIGFSFVAGYSDAEGNFILNQGKARFKIDSYDKFILFWISEFLQKQHIEHKLRQIAAKGDFQPPRYKYNGDLWRLNINRAPDLLRFITKINPFIIHGIQRKRMITCRDNILFRVHSGSVSL